MFTGIIEAIGTVESVAERGGDRRLRFATGDMDLTDVQPGDSIATNGCCLTAAALTANGFIADLSTETLALTTTNDWQVGTRVNLEKSLTPQTRLGGHLVSGHVDGVAEVLSRESSARAETFWLAAPPALARYIARKGSVTIDGTSLTVNAVDGPRFCLTIIPHTLEKTIIADYRPGTRVNLEVDLIARYLERLHQSDCAPPPEKPV